MNMYERMLEREDMIFEEGVEKGVEKGELRNLASLVCRKLKKGKAIDTIVDELESDEETIDRIVKVASHYAPDYDIDAICKELLKEAKEDPELVPA